MMIRVDMNHLGFDTINNYAVGNSDKDYTNRIPVFYLIATARSHTEICNLRINVIKESGRSNLNNLRANLYESLKTLMEVEK